MWLITYHNLSTIYALKASWNYLRIILNISRLASNYYASVHRAWWVQNGISTLFKQSFMFQFTSTSTLNLIRKDMSPRRTFPFPFPIVAIPFRKILNLKYVIIKNLVSLFQRASTAARIGMSTESSRSAWCVLSIKYVPLSLHYTTTLGQSIKCLATTTSSIAVCNRGVDDLFQLHDFSSEYHKICSIFSQY